jgi:hypothetical protein
LREAGKLKRLNNKQIEALSSACANLGNILFLGIGVAIVATGDPLHIAGRVLPLSLVGWSFCQTASVIILSYWRKEDE